MTLGNQQETGGIQERECSRCGGTGIEPLPTPGIPVTEDLAYFTGLLITDGWVRGNRLGIGLKRSDYQSVKKLCAFLGVSHDSIRTKKNGPNHEDLSIVEITNAEISQKLSPLGFVRGKKNRFVHASLSINKDFWRGVIDGDGHISYSSGGSPRVELTSPPGIIQPFIRFCRELGCLNPKSYTDESKVVKKVGVYSENALKFLETLYVGSNIHMERKYRVAMELLGLESKADANADD